MRLPPLRYLDARRRDRGDAAARRATRARRDGPRPRSSATPSCRRRSASTRGPTGRSPTRCRRSCRGRGPRRRRRPASGMKWVTGFATNDGTRPAGDPRASCSSTTPTTGVPPAILDGGPITAQRTAAVVRRRDPRFGPARSTGRGAARRDHRRRRPGPQPRRGARARRCRASQLAVFDRAPRARRGARRARARHRRDRRGRRSRPGLRATPSRARTSSSPPRRSRAGRAPGHDRATGWARRRPRRPRRLRDVLLGRRRARRRAVPGRRPRPVPGQPRRRPVRRLPGPDGARSARRSSPATASAGRGPGRGRPTSGSGSRTWSSPTRSSPRRAGLGLWRVTGRLAAVSRRPDVVVVGAGVMGAWTALRCAARRAGQTTLLDALRGRSSRGRRPATRPGSCAAAHGADPFYARWAREARSAWQRVRRRDRPAAVPPGRDALVRPPARTGFEAHSIATLTLARTSRSSALDPADDGRALAADRDRRPRLRGLRAGGRAAAGRGPRVRGRRSRRSPRPAGAFELAAVRPGRRRTAAAARRRGRRRAAVRRRTFVFAAGPWLPRLFPDLARRADHRHQAGRRLSSARPRATALDRRRVSRAGSTTTPPFYGLPAVDGRGFKIAPDRYGPPFDPTDGDRLVDPDTVRQVRALRRAPVPRPRRRAGRRDRGSASTSRRPTPSSSSTATPSSTTSGSSGGGSGHGFKHGPVIGSYLVSRIAGAPGRRRMRRGSR